MQARELLLQLKSCTLCTKLFTHAHSYPYLQVVNIAKEYTDQLSSVKVMELLEKQNAWPGLYFYLGSRLAFSEVRVDPHFLLTTVWGSTAVL